MVESTYCEHAGHVHEKVKVDKTLQQHLESHYASKIADTRHYFTYSRPNLIQENDIALFYDGLDSYKQQTIKHGNVYQTKFGSILHSDIIGKAEYGTRVFTSNMRGSALILRGTSDLYTRSLPCRTQILYTPDISQVLLRLQLRPGMRVCESGTGSGSLSVSLTKAILPTGRLFTFEFNPDRVVKARADFEKLGLASFITVTHRDVLANGFTLGTDGHAITDGQTDALVTPGSIDAIFLDLPSPQLAVGHAYAILKKRGRLCNFSPCIEQVYKATQEMAKLGFYDIRTFECLTREIEVRKVDFIPIGDQSVVTSLLPESAEEGGVKRKQKAKDKERKHSQMLATTPKVEARGHTGYLTFAIKF